jgi:N-methylhydantoinase B
MSDLGFTPAESIAASIIGGRLGAIVSDMGAAFANTARSSRISVRRQFACALLDSDCRVAAADNPRYVAALAATARSCVDAFRFDLADDDVLITNDPYSGSPSIHHFTVVAPVALSRDVKVYVAVIAHMGDVGGWVMGNYDPTARELRTEGVIFSPLKIVKFGRSRRDVLDTLLLNSRLADTFEGDLGGQLAAVDLGRRELGELTGRFDAARIAEGMESAIEYARRRTVRALGRIPEGRYEGEATFAVADQRHTVRAALERRGEETTVDLGATGEQAEGFFNCSPTTTRTQALIPLLGLLDDDVPWNSGVLEAVDVVTAPGTLASPEYPAPTGFSLEHVGREVSEAVRCALAAALPDETGPGLPSRDLAFTVRREERHGTVVEQLAVTDLSILAQPGCAAGSAVDGWGQPGPEALGRLPSVEEVERETGVTVQAMEYRIDSGGAGSRRGGLGVSTVIEFPADCSEYLYVVAGGEPDGAVGIRGASAGARGRVSLLAAGEEQVLDGVVVMLELAGGSTLRIDSAGGAGYGPPGGRPPDELRQDLISGRISAAAGRELYGADLDAPGAGDDERSGS